MKCPKCNLDIADGSKFCTKCGANIAEALEEQAKLKAAEEAKKAEELKRAEEEAKKAEEQRKLEEAKKVEEKKASEEKKEAEKAEKIEESIVNEKVEEPKEVENTNKSETKKGSKKEAQEPKDKKFKKKKKHTGLKVIFALLILVIIILAGCYGLYKIDLLPEPVNGYLTPIFETIEGWFGIDNKKSEENTLASDSEEKNTIKKKVEKEDLVFDYYDKKIFGKEYKIPEINLDYENVEKINKEIASLVEDEIKDLEKETEFPEMALAGTEYNWYLNDNILSLVFCTKNYHVENYYVYNVDVYTGETIENQEILDAVKMEEKNFTEKCVDAVKDYYENILYSSEVEQQAGYYYTEALNKSIAESNFKVSKSKIYLNDSGEVCIVAEVYLVAGATSNNFPINIESLRKNKSKTTTKSNTTNTVNTTNANITNNTNNTTNATNTTNTKNEVLNNTTNSVKNTIY